MGPELGSKIENTGKDGFDDGELRVETQGEQHGEKKDGPQRAPRQPCHQIGVGNKGQAGTTLDNVFHLKAQNKIDMHVYLNECPIMIHTSTPNSLAKKPRMEKIAKPANTDVKQLPKQTIMVSLKM